METNVKEIKSYLKNVVKSARVATMEELGFSVGLFEYAYDGTKISTPEGWDTVYHSIEE